MSWRNTGEAYGWAAIGVHWTSAIGVVLLWFLGERMEGAPTREAARAAQDLHVSVGVLLFTFLAARLLWSASQRSPQSYEKGRLLQILAKAVQGLFLLMIAVLIVSGPLAVWSTGRPIMVFDWFGIPSPTGRNVGLHEAMETVHGAATKLFWPLIVLHVLGALKHAIIDRDRTVQRILWVRRS